MGQNLLSIFNLNKFFQEPKPIKMTKEDIPQIIEIYKSYWGTIGLYKDSTLKKIISQKISYAYKKGGEIIAFCLIYYTKNKIGIITLICVKKEYKGHHLGKSLLSFCINNCSKLNIKKFSLHVSTTNLHAFTLYKNLGFIVKKHITNYYHDENPKDNDAFYMTLNI